MRRISAIFLLIIISGCASDNVNRYPPKPYDNPKEGYIVYTPKSGYQIGDGYFLKGFHASGLHYLDNCSGVGSLKPNKQLPANLSYSEIDEVIYLRYPGGPSMARCDINYEVIRSEAEKYIAASRSSAIAQSDAELEHRNNQVSRPQNKVEFGGYVATKENILGSVVLACYTGSLDSGGMLYVSKEEQSDRYKALLSLYEGEPANVKRISNAYNFARRNLSDRYPLDTMGQYRAGVCDQMVTKGKL